ncbi:type I restriction-modification system subunit M [Paenisporosarcina macmurdoensis]|uniref:site-specific DNA-methyltransferase (adenine-specific) n=1 Tax=Paenisporosarcina macmurdoensis TaxID=212659 RepID=A0ABW1LAU2_9BACL
MAKSVQFSLAFTLRGSMDASEYKNVVLGLLFLKYVSDSFEEKYEELTQDKWADPEDKDEYLAENIFWVPKEARWTYIKENAKKPEIGQIIDTAMIATEKENESLRGVLPKDYARPALDKTRLGETIDLFSFRIGDKESRSKDMLGRVYEYFLSKFASAEGKNGGEFYTPSSVVKLLVQMLEPYKGRVYDPCCGSGGMFVQSEKFVEEHQGRLGDIAVYGQESNPTTWKLAKMNLAIRGIDGNIGDHNADTFHNDLHKGLKADYILANPPFNISDWGGEKLKEDVRWQFGTPPVGNANYAWIQHMVSKLAPSGTAGFVLANGSMSTNTTSELEIRKNLIEQDLVECIVTLPGQLFYSTQIPVCLWFVTRNKAKNGKKERRGEILFIDARKQGSMVSRTLKEFSIEDINKISDVYHAWRGTNEQEYEDVAGFCKVAKLDEVREHEYILTPGRYVGLEAAEEDSEPFEEKMERLTGDLAEQFVKSKKLEGQIRKALEGIGYGV